ncbi:MAG: B12-binding domain-containing radical SAM protein [Candidatus Aenigmatarchaeota archaeon]|nr:MAG: B12-binding domain-containing radical SAM protein [Candidatus Aenigmarchaeota archaeon]
MNIEKIQLINPPLDSGIKEAGYSGSFPPMGLLYLGTYLENKYPGKHVEIIDGSITPMGKIRVDGDMVGIGALISTYNNALKIAEKAKNKGAYVILGNDHAKNAGDLIIKNRECVDSVCNSNQGWETITSLVDYVEGRIRISEVPGLIYREGGKIKSNPPDYGFKDRKLIADRNLADMEKYSENYMKIFGHLHDEKVTPATTQMMKGCGWGNRKGCLYCGITDIKPEHVDLDLAIKEYRYLKDKGVNFIYDICDDVFSQTGFLKKLIENDIKINFVYGRAAGVNDKSVELLKRLGVKRINMGMESGDDRMLESLRKNNPEGVETSRKTAKLLAENWIELYTSFVLASPGETGDSLQNSVDFFRKISEYGNVVFVDPSVLIPIRGSAAWDMMMRNEKYREKHLKEDLINTEELAQDWVEFACPDVDYNSVKKTVDQICSIAKEKGIGIGGYGVKGC